MSATDVHVTPILGGWQLHREGERYPSSRHRTRRSALRHAREMARASGSSVVVHGLDGRVTVEPSIMLTVDAPGTAGRRSKRLSPPTPG
ncbi:MAG: DUF2188 domain-containing protein [Ilumatobacteraceae bacterium]